MGPEPRGAALEPSAVRPRIGDERALQPRACVIEALARQIENIDFARKTAREAHESMPLGFDPSPQRGRYAKAEGRHRDEEIGAHRYGARGAPDHGDDLRPSRSDLAEAKDRS